MAANTDPIFGQIPKTIPVKLSGDIQSTDYRQPGDGVGDSGIKSVYTAGASGAKVTSIRAKASDTSSLSVLLIFISNEEDPSDDDLYLVHEIIVNAEGPDSTNPSADVLEMFEDFQLQPNQTLYVGSKGVGCDLNVISSIADFQAE